MGKLLPVILAVVGLVGGAAAGWLMKPPPPVEATPCLDAEGREVPPEKVAEVCPPEAGTAEPAGEEEPPAPDPAAVSEYVKLDRQFVVPVMKDGAIDALMVLSLSVEVAPGTVEAVLSREPRVRDALLRALFDHAYSGGFDGDFTAEYVMRDLRKGLLKAARSVAGPDVRDVLVADIIKQQQ